MSDIKLFALNGQKVTELLANTASLEKNLQHRIEENMKTFLGVDFLATEYSTGKTHKGRIDSLGLDENGCPVIIEYKRHTNENVINQGLFYLDWLLDHKAEFQWLVMEKMGKEQAENIEWSGTRLICIASDFTKYDEHAVQQINRNIELMRYRYFGDQLLLLELVNAQSVPQSNSATTSNETVSPANSNKKGERHKSKDKSQADRIKEASQSLLELYHELCDFTEGLGDEVQRKEVKLYTAYKKIKNFACFVVLPQKKDARIIVYLKLPPELAENNHFSRDVTHIGHWATGDLEINVRTQNDLAKTKDLIQQSYELN